MPVSPSMLAVAFISVYFAWVWTDTAPTWASRRRASFASAVPRLRPSTAMTPTTSSPNTMGATMSGLSSGDVSSRMRLRVGGGSFSKSRRSITRSASAA